jgi:hypothetical protein
MNAFLVRGLRAIPTLLAFAVVIAMSTAWA